ncbi:hypothetical protein [Occultella gossypii]|uniref:Uncharacterized protein n=1 Tax=Occultella gossypii TaxID=2800820 RepID=A0ABS7S5H2_9MICO|nr:hypothetical protein [Occultella gossypii]MBZ2195588.1 hypothetical protein [Occultella gossypii]
MNVTAQRANHTREDGIGGQQARIVAYLGAWLHAMEPWWTDGPDGTGWFGSGYNHWGSQTNLKYASAAAVVAVHHEDPATRELALRRAEASYRFAWDSHLSGTGACTDGTQWGHTWISALGIERAWFGVDLLRGRTGTSLDAGARSVLVSESEWLSTDYRRGAEPGVKAGLWNAAGRNDPESNLWNGALLWRTATRWPDEENAPRFREVALRFLANGVSLAADATDETMYDGQPLRDRHLGANFFDSMALDHHGYLNAGYMAICTSQAALLHFDQVRAGLPVPELLHLHQDVLWERLSSCVTPDGRLIRIGGDSRVRYAYCQEYVPVGALYAEHHLGDAGAADLVTAYLGMVDAERSESGAFYDRRLDHLARERPYYYVRLESDRANALAVIAANLDGARTMAADPPAQDAVAEQSPDPLVPADAPERSDAWHDDEHGVLASRGARRFASHSWRAFTTTQGLCLPVEQGDLAEYHLNLAPQLSFEGAQAALGEYTSGKPSRRVLDYWQGSFAGGFATVGQVAEGVELSIGEGWSGGPGAESIIAMVALPDDATVLGLQIVTTPDWYVGLLGGHGLNLGIPNDAYNAHQRVLRTQHETIDLEGPAAEDSLRDLGPQVCVDGRLTVRSLDAQPVQLLRRPTPHGGPALRSLGVETLAIGAFGGPAYVPPRTRIVDAAYLVHVEDAGPQSSMPDCVAVPATGGARAWRVQSQDLRTWTVVVNPTDIEALVEVPEGGGRELTTGMRTSGSLTVAPLRARVIEHTS